MLCQCTRLHGCSRERESDMDVTFRTVRTVLQRKEAYPTYTPRNGHGEPAAGGYGSRRSTKEKTTESCGSTIPGVFTAGIIRDRLKIRHSAKPEKNKKGNLPRILKYRYEDFFWVKSRTDTPTKRGYTC